MTPPPPPPAPPAFPVEAASAKLLTLDAGFEEELFSFPFPFPIVVALLLLPPLPLLNTWVTLSMTLPLMMMPILEEAALIDEDTLEAAAGDEED